MFLFPGGCCSFPFEAVLPSAGQVCQCSLLQQEYELNHQQKKWTYQRKFLRFTKVQFVWNCKYYVKQSWIFLPSSLGLLDFLGGLSACSAHVLLVCVLIYTVCGGQSHGLCQYSLHWENTLLSGNENSWLRANRPRVPFSTHFHNAAAPWLPKECSPGKIMNPDRQHLARGLFTSAFIIMVCFGLCVLSIYWGDFMFLSNTGWNITCKIKVNFQHRWKYCPLKTRCK